MTRIRTINRPEMNDEQGRVYDAAKAAGNPVGGPYYAYIRYPRLMQAAQEQVAGLDEAFGRGDLGPLLEWLRVHVHGVGSRLGFRAILEEATGRTLDPLAFQRHLRQRYLQTAS